MNFVEVEESHLSHKGDGNDDVSTGTTAQFEPKNVVDVDKDIYIHN